MGVDHGGQGGQVPLPRIWSGGDANANCPPPQILSYRYKNERSVAFKIRQNPFSAGALPRTPLGELTTLPRPLSRLFHPTRHGPTFGARHASPQKSSQIYAYAYSTQCDVQEAQIRMLVQGWSGRVLRKAVYVTANLVLNVYFCMTEKQPLHLPPDLSWAFFLRVSTTAVTRLKLG